MSTRRTPDLRWSGVFCLEGSWDDDLADRSSVLPVLELLERLRQIDFIHRDVGTRTELEHYLRRWTDEELDYNVLYLAFHYGESGLWISDSPDGEVSLDILGGLLADELDGCFVHFGSCSVMQAPTARLKRFLEQTGARAASGYSEEVDWLDSAAMDLLALGVVARYKQLGTAIKRLESEAQYHSLRKALGFKIVQA